MGRNAQRRRLRADEIAELASKGLSIDRIEKTLKAEGFAAADLVSVDRHATDGYEIRCDSCGRTALLPQKPPRIPDKISCPDCMRAAIAREGLK